MIFVKHKKKLKHAAEKTASPNETCKRILNNYLLSKAVVTSNSRENAYFSPVHNILVSYPFPIHAQGHSGENTESRVTNIECNCHEHGLFWSISNP
jgi:hypothetical protein